MVAVSLFGAVAVLSLVPSSESSLTVEEVDSQFREFESQFARGYSSTGEREERKLIFTENLGRIAILQAAEPSGGAEYSYLTRYADWTQVEFAKLNGFMGDELAPIDGQMETDSPVIDLPDKWDWREKGAVNPPKNQGDECGSCWAFSTVANMEGAYFVKTGKLVSLSEQELLDCSQKNGGCQGGLPSWAMSELAANHTGLQTESSYPYTTGDRFNETCLASKSQEKVFVDGYLNISSNDTQIAAALVKYGPLSTGMDSTAFQFYRSGVISGWLCQQRLNHAVTVVGYSQTSGVSGGTKYWTIKNSYGPSWGEKGYFRIKRGHNTCGIEMNVVTALVASPPVEVVV